MCLSRSWYEVRTDPPRLLVRDRWVSDHVQSLPLNFRSRWRESLASRLGAGVKTACMGSFEVEESLSIGNGFVDYAKRIFQRC